MKTEKKNIPSALIFVIFGACGDLARRKIMPALFNLFIDQHLPSLLSILAVDQLDMTQEALIKLYYESIQYFSRRQPSHERKWLAFARIIQYICANVENPATYTLLAKCIQQAEKQWKTKAVHIYYLATPPSYFEVISLQLIQAGLTQDRARDRIIIEKPFGTDLESAKRLNQKLLNTFQDL